MSRGIQEKVQLTSTKEEKGSRSLIIEDSGKD